MSVHDHHLFESREDIPDLVPPQLLLPSDRTDLRIVQASEHVPTTTTPIEVGFCVYKLGMCNTTGEWDVLEHLAGDWMDWTAEEYLERRRGNHTGRVIIRALTDPDRLAPLDLKDAYYEESKIRGFNSDEEDFFANFAANWGVLRQR